MRVARVVLVGFMGAGKSTVGPLLAACLGFHFADADRYLEEQAGLTVAEIFETRGEAAFRCMEADTVRQLIGVEGLVLALGGGAFDSESTRARVKDSPDTCVVFLEAPLETLLSRCARQSDSGELPVRPLLAALREDRARLEEKLAARVQHYRAAHFTILTGELTPAQVTQEIIARLRDFPLAMDGSRAAALGTVAEAAPEFAASEDIW